MSAVRPSPVAFPPIERHGVIGDRRTGALVSDDGTIDWFCAPNFDGPPVFAALIDPDEGGFCRFGPHASEKGNQSYLHETAILTTTWKGGHEIELADVMAWPGNQRAAEFRSRG